MTSFFDLISEIFIKYLVGIPDATDFDFSTSITTFRSIMGYANYFFPFQDLYNIFAVLEVVMTATLFGFLIIRWVRGSIPF